MISRERFTNQAARGSRLICNCKVLVYIGAIHELVEQYSLWIMSGLSATVLLAEDDVNDAFLIERAFKKAGLSHKVVHVLDGQQAVDYLGGEPPSSKRVQCGMPDLLLLDLKMPVLNGFEVLAWLRSRPDLSAMPVVVMSSSDHERDKAEARGLGATDYFRKPSDPADLVALVRMFDERWLQSRARAVMA